MQMNYIFHREYIVKVKLNLSFHCIFEMILSHEQRSCCEMDRTDIKNLSNERAHV